MDEAIINLREAITLYGREANEEEIL